MQINAFIYIDNILRLYRVSLSYRDPLLGHDCVAADRETPISRNDFRYELETPPFS